MKEEGYIKFHLNWIEKECIDDTLIEDINKVRTKLYDMGLIGEYANGIGFGNISKRIIENQFIISGSQTGGHRVLRSKHYSLVTGFDIEKNQVNCIGLVKASSESLTHGIIYKNLPDINSVIHIHNLKYWNILIDKVPSTLETIEFGTPELANDIIRLINNCELKEKKIFAMKGHKEGIVTFGQTVEEALDILLHYINLE